MTSIGSVIVEVPDPAVASAFYTAAFGLGDQVGVHASDGPTAGSRGFTLSLVVSQPATVDELIVAAPDGTIWKVATSSKKNTGPAARQTEDMPGPSPTPTGSPGRPREPETGVLQRSRRRRPRSRRQPDPHQ